LLAGEAESIVNPIFEEVLVCGYVIRALEHTRSIAFAVKASVAIRVSYHLYQGAIDVLGVMVDGLNWGWWFARTAFLKYVSKPALERGERHQTAVSRCGCSRSVWNGCS